MKLTVIGAGSTYTPELISGLITHISSLPVKEVSLMDIDKERLEKVSAFCSRMLDNAGVKIKITPTHNLEESIAGADFIITQIRVGGQQGRNFDISLGKKYGIVGQETTGVGGFAKAMRTIPSILNITDKIEKISPRAWLINFTNPSGIITEAINRSTSLKTIGLCNVPINMKMDAAEKLKVDPDDIYLDYVGLNHLGWVRHIYYRGDDVINEVISKGQSVPSNISSKNISDKFLQSLKMIPSPYLRYYYNKQSVIEEQANSSKTRAEEVMEIEKKLLDIYSNPEEKDKPEILSQRGGAYYSHVATEIMSSIYNDSKKEFIINVQNSGAVKSFRDTDVLEIPAIVSAAKPRPIAIGEVESEVQGLMSKVKAYERLTVEAAVEKSYSKSLLALVSNPLIDGVDQAEQALDEINCHYNLNLKK